MDDPGAATFAIRRFDGAPVDVLKIAKLYLRSVAEIGAVRYSAEQVGRWAMLLRPSEWGSRMSADYTYLAERAGTLCGFIELEPLDASHGRVRMLYRAPDEIAAGCVQPLYDRAERTARELGFMSLSTEASLLSESFFRRNAYALVGREVVDIDGVGISRARMEKRLAGGA